MPTQNQQFPGGPIPEILNLDRQQQSVILKQLVDWVHATGANDGITGITGPTGPGGGPAGPAGPTGTLTGSTGPAQGDRKSVV